MMITLMIRTKGDNKFEKYSIGKTQIMMKIGDKDSNINNNDIDNDE